MSDDETAPAFEPLFERAARYDVDEATIRSALADRRAKGTPRNGDGDREGPNPPDEPRDRSPARVVADADVLAADLFVDGAAREALDHLRRHSWTTLVASDPLLDDATAVIEALADADLAADWRRRMDAWRDPVTHPAGDHPALASAYRGGAMQVVSSDPSVTGPGVAAGLQGAMPVSVREPRAFATVFSPERLHPVVVGGEYPGPDRDPRY